MTDRGGGEVVVVTGANEGIGHHLLRTLVEVGNELKRYESLAPLASSG
jgi:NADP-dependent 3-hydroxy acid dehydrogenase YdfG